MFIRAKVLLSAYGVTCMTSQAFGSHSKSKKFQNFRSHCIAFRDAFCATPQMWRLYTNHMLTHFSENWYRWTITNSLHNVDYKHVIRVPYKEQTVPSPR